MDQITTSTVQLKVGVCAMDTKARSKAMRNILDRLTNEFQVIIFGDKMILDEDIEHWPRCDFLIAFYSKGFPLNKAVDYVKLRRPFCINDLAMQQLLRDRRWVLAILEAIDVPSPTKLLVNRNEPQPLPDEIKDNLNKNLGIDLTSTLFVCENVIQLDDDTLMIGKKKLKKPFVEKPVDGENHNVWIYYPRAMGGGVGNKSSEYFPDIVQIRQDQSYIYEEFMDVTNSEDLKVYTIGPYFTYAETRKSPVVDGIVRRNADGKEVRTMAVLSDEEQDMARRVCMAFGQAICGFDVLRCGNRSLVIDVNGWSFVKGSDVYYDMCSKMLRETFLRVATSRKTLLHSPIEMGTQWVLKSFIAVFRHADRTPKQKSKFVVSSPCFVNLVEPGSEETLLRGEADLLKIKNAAKEALTSESEDNEKSHQLLEILEKKSQQPGTKVQIKPLKDNRAQLIIKWGGEFTHAGRHHSKDFGENLRKDLLLMNRKIMEDVMIFTSSERRVMATADIFAKAFFSVAELPHDYLIVSKEMLDDNFNAKEELDVVKSKLLTILSADRIPLSIQHLNIHPEFKDPCAAVDVIIKLLTEIRETFHLNYVNLDLDTIKPKWCCAESPVLFKERWDKLFGDFCDVERSKFDPSKISELYDSLKYDALHHREFLERMFVKDPSDTNSLVLLYRHAKFLFDFVAPQEFGLTPEEKLTIGKSIALSMLVKIINDLTDSSTSKYSSTRFYFTKESHVHALLNLVLYGGLPCNVGSWEELDYLTQISFEVYERSVGSGFEHSLRIGFSPGAHDASLLDVQMDSKHALSVAPRRWITDHIKLEDALNRLNLLI